MSAISISSSRFMLLSNPIHPTHPLLNSQRPTVSENMSAAWPLLASKVLTLVTSPPAPSNTGTAGAGMICFIAGNLSLYSALVRLISLWLRWHGDPATTRPSQSRNTSSNSNNQAGPPDDTDADDQQSQQQQQPQPQPQPQQQQQQQQQAPTNTPNTTTATTTTTTVDFSATDPTIHGFTPQLTYISPQQTLRDNPLVPPSPATVPTGPSSIHSALNGVGMTNNAPSTSQRAPHLFAGTPNMTHSSTLAGSSGTHHQVPVSTSSPNGMGAAVSHALATSNSLSSLPSSSSSSSASSASSSTTATTMSSSSSSNDSPVVNISITQNMLSAYMQFLQVQTQTGKMKLEYLRRREEREEKEMFQRREMERIKLEREAAEFEHSKQSANIKQKADRAIVSYFCFQLV